MVVELLIFIIVLALAYLLGSIPFGLLLAKALKKQDPRVVGSGNIGATNMLRVNGKALGILTLFLDMLKGVIAILMAKQFVAADLVLYAGLLAFIGHCYPVWLKFKGGKGVATGIAVLFVASPLLGACMVLNFITMLYAKRYVSLAALTAFGGIVFYSLGFWLLLPSSYSLTYFIISLIMTGIVFIRHQSNIKNIRQGTENKI